MGRSRCNLSRAVVAACLTALLTAATRGVADVTAPGTGYVDFHGYPGCVFLQNADTRVVIAQQAGGRVLEYSWKGANAIYLDPADAGWVYAEGARSVDLSGGRFDIGPELVIPNHPQLWGGPWTVEIIGPRAVRLTSVDDEPTGVRLVRDFRLEETGSRLVCEQRVINVSQRVTEWCHFGRTLAVGRGICVVPLGDHVNRYPKGYVVYGPGRTINYAPEDPNLRVRDGFLEIIDTPLEAWIAIDSYAGWFSYLMMNDLMFVKRFPTYPERMYNEIAAFTVVMWYDRDVRCELEPFGPKEILAPGQSSTFIEEWWLLPQPFPVARDAVDLREIARRVDRDAR